MERILLIHCGGTLGMVKELHGYTTIKGNLIKLILANPNIARTNLGIAEENNFYSHKSNCSGLVSFLTSSLICKVSAIVDFFELPCIIDSCCASIEEWVKLTDVIDYFYDSYGAFVIIHGTDTLSYAASFLSFMIEGLTVPIIFTGSMIPLAVKGNDAERNLIGAIKSCLLVHYKPNIYIFFNGWLHRGTRTTKISSVAFDAFYSRNPIRIEDLAENYSYEGVFVERRIKSRPFFNTKVSRDVGIFKIFPAIQVSHLSVSLFAYKAVVLETYGSGTFPTNREDLLDIMEVYIKNGGIIVNVSQCADGDSGGFYDANNYLSQIGVTSAKNMTTESAFAKLSILLANKPDKINEWFDMPFSCEIGEEVDTTFYSFNNYTGVFF